MNPGIASCPWRSITFVFGPIIGLMSPALPSACTRSPLIAIASASGRASSTVTMCPFVSTRSAGGACAVPPRCAWEVSVPTSTENAVRQKRVFRMPKIIAATCSWIGAVSSPGSSPPRVSGATSRGKEAFEVPAQDQRPVFGADARAGHGTHLRFIDVLLPAAREERRVRAEEQARRSDDGHRAAEDRFERERGVKARPAVGARRIEMDGLALIRRYQCFAEEAGAEVRDDHRHLRKSGGDASQREWIAEPKIEAVRQSQLLPHADGQHAAVHEHGGAVRGGCLEHALDRLVIDPIPVHRGKEADAAHVELLQRAVERRVGGTADRVVHEEADEPLRVMRHRFSDGNGVARDARDQRGARNIVAIELGDPAIAQFGWRAGSVPLEPGREGFGPAALGSEQFEESRRKEMAMRVVDHLLRIILELTATGFRLRRGPGPPSCEPRWVSN